MAAQIANFTSVWRFPSSEYKEHIITVLDFRPSDLEASFLWRHYGNWHCAVLLHVPVVNIFFLRGQTLGWALVLHQIHYVGGVTPADV